MKGNDRKIPNLIALSLNKISEHPNRMLPKWTFRLNSCYISDIGDNRWRLQFMWMFSRHPWTKIFKIPSRNGSHEYSTRTYNLTPNYNELKWLSSRNRTRIRSLSSHCTTRTKISAISYYLKPWEKRNLPFLWREPDSWFSRFPWEKEWEGRSGN